MMLKQELNDEIEMEFENSGNEFCFTFYISRLVSKDLFIDYLSGCREIRAVMISEMKRADPRKYEVKLSDPTCKFENGKTVVVLKMEKVMKE